MKLLFFGRLGDRIGREMDVELPAEGCAVAELRRMLSEAAPEVASSSVRVSVDWTIVPDSFVVRPEHEVAFLPPLSGG
jgi:sulfur-carrier protein